MGMTPSTLFSSFATYIQAGKIRHSTNKREIFLTRPFSIKPVPKRRVSFSLVKKVTWKGDGKCFEENGHNCGDTKLSFVDDEGNRGRVRVEVEVT